VNKEHKLLNADRLLKVSRTRIASGVPFPETAWHACPQDLLSSVAAGAPPNCCRQDSASGAAGTTAYVGGRILAGAADP
jgi:hypothetical protein